MKAQLQAALEAMKVLSDFDPRLAGPLAGGVSDSALPITLHVCAEHPDSVRLHLEENRIPTRTIATRMHVPRGPSVPVTGLSFLAGEQEFRIWIFDDSAFRQRLCVGDEIEPSTRLKRKAVEERVAAAGS